MLCVLLNQFFHAQTGGFVLHHLTLCLCGPVLNPGSLTKNILIPGGCKRNNILGESNSLNTAQVNKRNDITKVRVRPHRTHTSTTNLQLILTVHVNVSGCAHDEIVFVSFQI